MSSVDLTDKVLTFTMLATSEAAFVRHGPMAGDVLMDNDTGTVWFVDTADLDTRIVTAVQQNNYRSDGGSGFDAIDAIQFDTGILYCGNARIFTPSYPTIGDLTSGSATIANVGRADGNGEHLTEILSADYYYVDEIKDRPFDPDESGIASVTIASPGHLTLHGNALYSQSRRRLELFARRLSYPSSGIDDISGVTGAWSMSRALVSGYAGDLYTPGSGSNVDVMFDQSGNGFDFSVPAGSAPTLATVGPNSRAALSFDGSTKRFATATSVMVNLIANNAGYFIGTFVVDNAPNNASAAYDNNAVVTNYSNNDFGIWGKNNTSLLAYNFDNNDDKAPLAFTPGTLYVVEWEHSGGNVRGRINGGSWQTVASGNTNAEYTADRLALFSASSAGLLTQGKFLELAFFNPIPSDADKDTLVADFMAWAGA